MTKDHDSFLPGEPFRGRRQRQQRLWKDLSQGRAVRHRGWSENNVMLFEKMARLKIFGTPKIHWLILFYPQ